MKSELSVFEAETGAWIKQESNLQDWAARRLLCESMDSD